MCRRENGSTHLASAPACTQGLRGTPRRAYQRRSTPLQRARRADKLRRAPGATQPRARVSARTGPAPRVQAAAERRAGGRATLLQAAQRVVTKSPVPFRESCERVRSLVSRPTVHAGEQQRRISLWSHEGTRQPPATGPRHPRAASDVRSEKQARSQSHADKRKRVSAAAKACSESSGLRNTTARRARRVRTRRRQLGQVSQPSCRLANS